MFTFFAAMASEAPRPRPSVIYGTDDRIDYFQIQDWQWRRRADSAVALIRESSLENQGPVTRMLTEPFGPSLGLCASEPFFDQERASFCTGFLLEPHTVITAGHCVRTQEVCDKTRFVFGFRMEQSAQSPRSVSNDMIFSCKRLVHSVALARGEDFAVIELDRPVTHVAPLAYRRFGQPVFGDPLVVLGHPLGLPLKFADNAQVRSVAREFLNTNLDTYGGNSGSAVFNAVTGDVEGVLVRGEMDWEYKDGCRVSKRCDSTLCRGEDVTLIERVMPYLSGN